MSGHLDDARLVALGLGEAPSPEEGQHLGVCPACAGSLDADGQLWASVRRLPQPIPPRDFASHALGRFQKARGVRHRPREVALGALVVLALAAVMFAWMLPLVPGALVSFSTALPRWPALLSAGSSWGRVLVAALPGLGLCALALLAAVAVLLRRLTAAPVK